MGTKQAPTLARSPEQVSTARQCPHCGAFLSRNLPQCPKCRETIPKIRRAQQVAPVGERGQIRQGLLCILLAAAIHYFAGGYSTMNVPFPIDPVVTVYLSPLLFWGGLSLTLYGFYLRNRV
jgi:hypothetical protein